MNAAVHTSARVHRCRDDLLGVSAIYLATMVSMMSRKSGDLRREVVDVGVPVAVVGG
jgi:hypothetical protein